MAKAVYYRKTMKNQTIKLIIIIVLIFCKKQIVAQCNPDSLYKTDWKLYSGQAGQNSFNWTQIHPQIVAYIKGRTGIDSIRLPYFCVKPVGSGSCENDNLTVFHDIDANKQDIKPEDGWELVIKDFGTPSDRVENPRLVLYNKYTGKIRIFVLISDETQTQIISLNTMLVNGKNRALMQFVTGTGNSLEDWDPLLTNTTINKYESQTDFWVWTEFQTSYDPCTCNDQTASTLQTEIYSLSSDSIKMVANGTIKEIVKNGNSVGNQSNNLGSSGSLVDKAGIIVESATKGYEDWEKQAANYLGKANKGAEWLKKALQKKMMSTFLNTEEKFLDSALSNWQVIADSLWKRLEKDNKFYEKLILRFGCEDYINPNFISNWNDLIQKYGTVKDKVLDAEKLQKINKTMSVLKGIGEAAPYIGAAISLYKLFSAGGTSETSSQASQSPSPFTAEINMNITGTINHWYAEPKISYYLPGSVHSRTNSKAPYYNNILGVFNILKTPTFEHVKYEDQDYSLHINNPCEIISGRNPQFLNSYRLKDDLKYLLNPASMLEIRSIDAAYIIEFDSMSLGTNGAFHPAGISIPKFETGFTISHATDSIPAATGWDLEYLDVTNKKMSFRTKYVPISAFKYVNILLTDNLYKPKIYIKFYIRAKRKDNPNADDVVLVHTFNTGSLNQSNLKNTDLYSTFWNYKMVSSEHYAGTQVPCQTIDYYKKVFKGLGLSPFADIDFSPKKIIFGARDIINSDLFAADTIIINSGAQIVPGITIVAGKSILVKSGVVVPAGVKLLIKNRLFDNNGYTPAYEANASEINSICNSNNYKIKNDVFANSPFVQNKHNSEKTIKNLAIYPNPNMGDFTISLSSTSNSIYIIEIFNMTGQVIYKEKINVTQGVNKNAITLDGIPQGIYMVKISNEEFSKTEKIIISTQ